MTAQLAFILWLSAVLYRLYLGARISRLTEIEEQLRGPNLELQDAMVAALDQLRRKRRGMA